MKIHKALKHVFIPHEGNEYKPHFFRELSVGVILFGSVFLLGASLGSSFFIHKTVLGVSVAADVLVDLTNESRIAYAEAPLTRNTLLDQAAALKGNDMVTQGYFAHESPTGVTPWHWFKEVGYTFLYAGENLAVNFTESKDVEDAWLASPLHRKNILDARFNEIGLATVQGVYKDVPTIFVVQMFGTPAVAAAPKPVEVTTVATSTPSEPVAVKTTPTPVVSDKLAIGNGEVRGEEVATPKPVYEPIITTPELAVVKNTEEVEPSTYMPNAEPTKYSTWYGRLAFGGSRYVDMIYKGLIILVAFALLTMVLIEVKKQHWKHIAYGVLMLAVLTLLVYINQGFF